MRSWQALVFTSLVLLTVNCDEYHEDIPWVSSRRVRRSAKVEAQERSSYWMKEGARELEDALKMEPNKRMAKNIVLVIGDGMSLSTNTAGRIYKGQRLGTDGVSSHLSWDRFPHIGLSKTYNMNSMVPDSAATAFSMYSGVKGPYYTMGYDNNIKLGDLSSLEFSEELSTVLDWAQEADMMTGLVSTARVTHATPAALYAKTAHRDWECDTVTPAGARDIALQLVETVRGRNIDVVLGGGRAAFTPISEVRERDLEKFNCSRKDNVDLVSRWKSLHPSGSFLASKSDLLRVDPSKTDSLLGLFSWSHIPYDDELSFQGEAPSLLNMTSTALNFLLSRSEDRGFFLMVEGGRIDHANHLAQAHRALSETVAMDRAVEEILRQVNQEETLIIVTADHSHTLAISGYPGRTADITGISRGDGGWVMKGEDNQPMSILGYVNGPGFMKLAVRENSTTRSWEGIERAGDLKGSQLANHSFVFPGAVPIEKETHGGDDVGIFARGPWSHLFHSVHEQTYIAHVMSFAACIGPDRHHGPEDRCTRRG